MCLVPDCYVLFLWFQYTCIRSETNIIKYISHVNEKVSTMISQGRKLLKNNLVMNSFLLHQHKAELNAEEGTARSTCSFHYGVILVSEPT